MKYFRHLKTILLFPSVLFFVTACNDDNNEEANSDLGEASYTVTFNSTWSESTHPDNFPGNPHFSGLVGLTHNTNITLWAEDELSSEGIKLVAETGSKSTISTEINDLIASGDADKLISEGGIGNSPGDQSFSLVMKPDFSFVSIVSMLAPSPDWIVGVSSLNLSPNGVWLDSETVELFVYDAGTDDGEDYTSANEPASPAQNIFRIEESPFLVNGEVKSIGTMTFTKQ